MAYYVNGKEVTREEFDEAFPAKPLGVPDGHRLGCWPLGSDALAINPKNIAKHAARDKELGVPTEYDEMGRPQFGSRGHRKAYSKAYGVHDNEGGYGDA